jgi:hypothetical protein
MKSFTAKSFKGTRAHIDFLIERVAGHLLSNPTWENQLLARLPELDFGNNHTFEKATVFVDILRCPGMLDKEPLLLQRVVLTQG